MHLDQGQIVCDWHLSLGFDVDVQADEFGAGASDGGRQSDDA